jgi:hypothetical protein
VYGATVESEHAVCERIEPIDDEVGASGLKIRASAVATAVADSPGIGCSRLDDVVFAVADIDETDAFEKA